MPSGELVRSLLSTHGKTAPQSTTDWKGSFPLPDSIATFYREVGPVDLYVRGYGNTFFLPSLTNLWRFQQGYLYHPKTAERLRGWSDDWLVVADEGGGAFIFSKEREVILYALHGEGKWEPKDIFPDILTMAACLGVLGTIVVKAGQDLTDEQSNIRPVHLDEALNSMGSFLPSRQAGLTVLECLCWC